MTALMDTNACNQIKNMKRTAKVPPSGITAETLLEYSRWMAKHSEELSRKYPHKFIAVYRNRLVAVGDSLKEVREAAEREGITEPYLMEQVPTAEDMEAIL